MRMLLSLPALLLASSPALADTLPLRRGAYVQNGASCRAPADAVLRGYDGQAIGSRGSGQCRASVLAHVGRRYTLRQNCVQYGERRPHRATERLKVRIDSDTSFTDLIAGSRYRLCPGLRL